MKTMYLFAATIAALSLPRFAFAEAGFAFEVTMSGTKNGKTLPAIVFKTLISGPKARIEIPVSKDDWKKGDYLLTTDNGKTFTLVSPSRKTALIYDAPTVQALMEKENKGITVSDPETAWASVGQNQSQFTRRYEIKFRQGLLSGTGKIDEIHQFTIAPAEASGASGPTYNPMINYTLMELASLLLKNPKFAAQGLSSVLPKGFVQKAVLNIKTVTKAFPFGGEKEEVVTTLYSSSPMPTDVPAVAFLAPTDYKNGK